MQFVIIYRLFKVLVMNKPNINYTIKPNTMVRVFNNLEYLFIFSIL